jgi:mono/diheme cytochrome c family protein
VSIGVEIMKRYPRPRHLSVALALLGGMGTAFAQNLENGERLSERWCSECHAFGTASGRSKGAPPFAAIAAREAVTVDMIASFLLLPHATMPNLQLSRKDAHDIAAFVMDTKK